jgi:cell division protein FtsI/penicillin-binding protein 2
MAKDYILEKRKFVIGGIAISIVLIYLIRLFVLQITTDDYKKNADSNAFLNKIQYPSRGAIYDRTGKLLVFNQPAYDITIVPKEIENLDTLDLCQSLNITRAQFLKIMSDMRGVLDLIQKSVTVSILLVVISRDLQYKKTYQINQNNGDSNASDYKFALL